MKHKQTFETFAPLFPGFYGTLFEYEREEDDIQSYNEEYKTDLNWDDFDWDYREYHNRVSKAFVNRLGSEINQFLPVKITFQELHSPREYNFGNDSIYISIELNLKQLLGLIKERKEQAREYFKDNYTSYDGFISFHSNDIENWLNPKYILEDTAHRIGALLNCLCSIEIEQDDIYYWVDSEMYIDFWPKNEIPA